MRLWGIDTPLFAASSAVSQVRFDGQVRTLRRFLAGAHRLDAEERGAGGSGTEA